MYKKLTLIVSIFIVIDIAVGSPLSDESTTTEKALLRKRDVSLLKHVRQNSENNNVAGHEAQIISSVYKVAPNDNYYFAYEQTDGQKREETGIYEYDSELNMRKLKVNGFYEYIRPDGIKQRVEYSADDMGFHPNIVE